MNVLITNLAPSGTKAGDKAGRKQPIIKALKHLTASGQKVPKWLANEALDYSISEPSLFSAEEVQACMDSILDTKAPSIEAMNKALKSNQDVPMSRRRAKLLADYANRLAEMLENAPDDKDLAEWVQSKIDRAASAIQSAYHYLEHDELEKGAGHKYIRRIPKGRDKRTGRMRYDYVYKEHHRGGLRAAVEDLKAGEAFKLKDPSTGQDGHFHVKAVKGSVVVVEHDETGRSVTMTKSELKALLMKEHGQALKENFQAKKETYERMKRDTPKHIGLKAAFNRLQAAADKAGIKLPATARERYASWYKEQAENQEPNKEVGALMRTPEPPAQGQHKPLSPKFFAAYRRKLNTDKERLRYLKNIYEHPRNPSRLNRPNEMTTELYAEVKANLLEDIKELEDQTGEHTFKQPANSKEIFTRVKRFFPEIETIYDRGITATIKVKAGQVKDLKSKLIKHPTHPIQVTGNLLRDIHLRDLIEILRGEENKAAYQAQSKDNFETMPEPAQEPAQAPQPPARAQLIETATQEPAQPAKIDNFELAEHTHTKTGVKLYTAKQKDRVDRDEFKRRVQIAKKYKGRYDSRYAKAYIFKNAEDARKFALEVEGKPTDSTAPTTNNFETMPEAESVDNFETMPKINFSEPRQAKKRKVFKEVTAGELYQTRALIDESEVRGVYEDETLASLKKKLEPDRLAAESGIQEGGLLQGIENATGTNPLANEYKNFQVRTVITFDRNNKAVRNERGNPRGISDFIREKLSLNTIGEVRAQKEEIGKIANELLTLGIGNAVKRTKDTAAKRKNKTEERAISIFDYHIEQAQNRLDTIKASNLKEDEKLKSGIEETIELTKEAKEVYRQRSESLLNEALSKNNNQAIIDGLLENSTTRFHFTITPQGPAAKKLTETIVKDTLDQVLKDIAKTSLEPSRESEPAPAPQPPAQLIETTSTEPKKTDYEKLMPQVTESGDGVLRHVINKPFDLKGQDTSGAPTLKDLSDRSRFPTVARQAEHIISLPLPQLKAIANEVREKTLAYYAELKPFRDKIEKLHMAREEAADKEHQLRKKKESLPFRRRNELDTKIYQARLAKDEIYQQTFNAKQEYNKKNSELKEKDREIKTAMGISRRIFIELRERAKAQAPAPTPAPARAQLIETASDQSAESAAVRITPSLSEERLTNYSSELNPSEIAQIYDRSRFITVAKETPTKTLMRSKKQRAIDNELILMHQRLDIHAGKILGPLKPRVTQAHKYGPMFNEGTREPEHREKIRAKIKADIQKLYRALNPVKKSAHSLINYRAAIYKALNGAA